jgi:uncharacterized membrane protein YkvA (DUF1232 family)
MTLKERINKLKNYIAALFLALKNKKTPWYAKIMAGITVGYALSPIDLIPDFIPILGYLDDIIILPFFIFLSIKLIPKAIMEQSLNEASELWAKGKPQKWYYALPIIVLYVILGVVIMNAVL